MISPVFLLSLGSGLVWILPALLFFEIYFFYLYMCVFAYESLCSPSIHRCPWRPEGIEYPETGFTDGSESTDASARN